VPSLLLRTLFPAGTLKLPGRSTKPGLAAPKPIAKPVGAPTGAKSGKSVPYRGRLRRDVGLYMPAPETVVGLHGPVGEIGEGIAGDVGTEAAEMPGR
jgi:hypothetical protein